MTAGRNKNVRSKRYVDARLKARIDWFQNKKAQKKRAKARKKKYK